jgi:hypothetical protein
MCAFYGLDGRLTGGPDPLNGVNGSFKRLGGSIDGLSGALSGLSGSFDGLDGAFNRFVRIRSTG